MDTCFVNNIVESNGKTFKENNCALPHEISLGSLVEVSCSDSDFNGVRLFVVELERDCDGEPLYALSFKKGIVEEFAEYKNTSDPELVMLHRLLLERLKGSVLRGWSKESLVVIS